MPETAPAVDPNVALRAALDSANRANAELRRERDTAVTTARSATAQTYATQEIALDNAIAALTQQREGLKAAWATLQETGDFKGASDVLERMTDASARIAQYQAQKGQVTAQRQQAEQQPQPTGPQYNPTEQAWIDANPRYTTDPTFQAKAQAAAVHASNVLGLVKDSPEYWAQIERTVYPERSQDTPPAGNQRQAAEPNADLGDGGDGSPFSDTGEPFDDTGAEPPPVVMQRDHHNLEATVPAATNDAPVMRISAVPDDQQPAPQQRQLPVGRGGEGMRSVAAPPSRRVAQLAGQRASRNGVIEPTQGEYETAITLYDQINPDQAATESDEGKVRWYALNYNSPSAQRKLRKWYGNVA